MEKTFGLDSNLMGGNQRNTLIKRVQASKIKDMPIKPRKQNEYRTIPLYSYRSTTAVAICLRCTVFCSSHRNLRDKLLNRRSLGLVESLTRLVHRLGFAEPLTGERVFKHVTRIGTTPVKPETFD